MGQAVQSLGSRTDLKLSKQEGSSEEESDVTSEFEDQEDFDVDDEYDEEEGD